MTRLFLFAALAGCGNNTVQEATRQVAKVVPAVEKISDEVTREPVQCEQPFKTDQPRGCTSQTITCGSVVEGNNANMPRHFSDQFYVTHFCTPQRHYYEESGEALYRMEVPANTQADIRLDSDCADLDVSSMGWADTSECPAENTTRLAECEMDTKPGGGKIRVTTVDKPQVFVVAVDGKQGATGNFRLTVTCSNYR